MKKLMFLAVAISLTISAYSQAQLAIGIKAGPNFANIDTDMNASANYKNRSGFHGGAFVQMKFGKIALQPELLFSQQGSKVTFNAMDFDANYSYFNVPILLKLYTVAGIHLQAGPQFGFLASKDDELLDYMKTQNPGIKDEVKNSDFSVALGVGWDLPFGLTLDGRYNLGISDNSGSAAEVKNQVWQLSLGYKLFKFGK